MQFFSLNTRRRRKPGGSARNTNGGRKLSFDSGEEDIPVRSARGPATSDDEAEKLGQGIEEAQKEFSAF